MNPTTLRWGCLLESTNAAIKAIAAVSAYRDLLSSELKTRLANIDYDLRRLDEAVWAEKEAAG